MNTRCFSAHGPSWSFQCSDRYTYPCVQHFRYWAMKEWGDVCQFSRALWGCEVGQ